jgi:hypothetical protein
LKRCEAIGSILPKELKLEDVYFQVTQPRAVISTSSKSSSVQQVHTANAEQHRNARIDGHSSVDGSIYGEEFSTEIWPSPAAFGPPRNVPFESPEVEHQQTGSESQLQKSVSVKTQIVSRTKAEEALSFQEWSLDYQLEPDDIIRQLAEVSRNGIFS